MKTRFRLFQAGAFLLLSITTYLLAACSSGPTPAPSILTYGTEEPISSESQGETTGGTVTVDPTPFTPREVTPRLLSRTELPTCTYTASFLAAHPDRWLAENIQIGGLIFTRAEVVKILGSNYQDPTSTALQQFLATTLNLLRGTDSAMIEPDLAAAGAWLEQHSRGSFLSEDERRQALDLAESLRAYNAGEVGPKLCPDVPPTSTPTSTATPSPIPTAPPRSNPPTPTGEPTESTSSGDEDPGPTQPVPTLAIPTDVPPTSTVSQPTTDAPATATTLPAPTDLPPPPPTDEPTPTNAPLNTPTVSP